MIRYICKEDYLNLVARSEVFSDELNSILQDMIDRRIHREPLAYILESAEFCGHEFYVQPGVLIPRPETEEFVDYAKEMIQTILKQRTHVHIFECGLGSGVISLSLAKQFSNIQFYGWDISDIAIDVTLKNKQRLGVNNLEVIHNNFFNCIDKMIHLGPGILLSNPPYVSEEEYLKLEPELFQEPKIALVTKDDGLSIIKQLIDISFHQKWPLLCEIGSNQFSKIQTLYAYKNISFLKDLSGQCRFLKMLY